MQKPKLVAHRGFAAEYPENSLIAFNAAIASGCQYLELDVQISKDHQAVVIHDTNLSRTGGRNVDLLNSDWQDVHRHTIGEPDRFGDRYKNEKLPLLDDFVKLLQENPSVHAFVEIKEESVDHLGAKMVLDIVCNAINSVKTQCTLISFDAALLYAAKDTVEYPLGYVLHKYDETHLATAQALSPDILICNYKKIPDDDNSLWQGPWDWFLYEIVEAELATKWAGRGVKYIETMQIAPMIKALE